MKLYYGPGSAPARKVRVVLHEKNLEFEGDIVDGLRPADEFKSTTPMLMVPVLEDGELRLFESNVIVEYLLATYPDTPTGRVPPLSKSLYRGGEHKWMDREVLAAIDTLTSSAINLLVMEANEGLSREKVSYLERQAARMRACLDWLDERATPEGFVPGEFSMPDISLIAALGLIDRRELVEWRGRNRPEQLVSFYSQRPSIVETRHQDGQI